jgi:uncharacterized low-complexity protein
MECLPYFEPYLYNMRCKETRNTPTNGRTTLGPNLSQIRQQVEQNTIIPSFIVRRTIMKARTATLTLALTTALGAAGIASAAGNPFALNTLGQGYQVAAAEKAQDGKCGEGKCGATKKAQAADVQPADAKAPVAKAKDGKCGEGKCGNKK